MSSLGSHWLFAPSLLFQSQGSLGLLSCVKTVGFPLWEHCVCQAEGEPRGMDLLSCLIVVVRWILIRHLISLPHSPQRSIGSNFIHWSVTIIEIVFLTCTTFLLEFFIPIGRPSFTPLCVCYFRAIVWWENTRGGKTLWGVKTREFPWFAWLFLIFKSCNLERHLPERGSHRPEIKLWDMILKYNVMITSIASLGGRLSEERT